MSSNVRAFPMAIPPQPSQQDWVWDGVSWSPPACGPAPCPPPVSPPFPCPPPGFPTPCPPWFPPPAGQAPWYPGANGGVSFSATPPVNPIRGNFWWDGVMLHLFDGAAWVVIGPTSGAGGSGGSSFVGTSPPPNPASGTTWWNGTIFQVWDGTTWKLVGPPTVGAGTTLQTFAITQPTPVTVGTTSSAWTAVPLNTTPAIDTQAAWNGSSLRLTPNKAGYYQFQARGINTGTAAGIAVVKNDPGTFTSLSSDITVAIATTSATGWISLSGIAQMNGTTDYVRLWGYETTGHLPNAGSNPVLAAFELA